MSVGTGACVECGGPLGSSQVGVCFACLSQDRNLISGTLGWDAPLRSLEARLTMPPMVSRAEYAAELLRTADDLDRRGERTVELREIIRLFQAGGAP